MTLAAEDIEYIKRHLPEWLDQSLAYGMDLRERIVRVEAELKHQRELIQQILVQMDKRFESTERRFDQIDKRLDLLDQHLQAQREDSDRHFAELREDMNRRFEAADQRFEMLIDNMNQRFQASDRRFTELREDMNQRFVEITRRLDRFVIWSLGLYVTGIGAVLALLLRG